MAGCLSILLIIVGLFTHDPTFIWAGVALAAIATAAMYASRKGE